MSDLERIEREAKERRAGKGMKLNDTYQQQKKILAEAEAAVDELLAIAKEQYERWMQPAILLTCNEYVEKVGDNEPDLPVRCIELLREERDKALAQKQHYYDQTVDGIKADQDWFRQLVTAVDPNWNLTDANRPKMLERITAMRGERDKALAAARALRKYVRNNYDPDKDWLDVGAKVLAEHAWVDEEACPDCNGQGLVKLRPEDHGPSTCLTCMGSGTKAQQEGGE